jgi:hypothetical protein
LNSTKDEEFLDLMNDYWSPPLKKKKKAATLVHGISVMNATQNSPLYISVQYKKSCSFDSLK